MTHRGPVLVIGGTRGTGLLVARLLDERGVPVRVLARDPASARRRLRSEVEVVGGDLTRSETLPPALEGAADVVFTAGCRSGRPARGSTVEATDYRGVLDTLATARETGFEGRFLYMTSAGVTSRSLSTRLLNLYKGNTLFWRRRAEDAIRASGLDYTVVRAGILLNRPGWRRAIRVTQEPLPLSVRYRIARADVAEGFVAALDHPRAARATFDVAWDRGPRRESWDDLLGRLRPGGDP